MTETYQSENRKRTATVSEYFSSMRGRQIKVEFTQEWRRRSKTWESGRRYPTLTEARKVAREFVATR